VAAEDGSPVTEELRYGAGFLRRHGWRLLLVFIGLLLPLWGFAELADEIREQEAIPFDEPILRFAHTLAREGFDRFFVLISKAGYRWGVVPLDIALVLWLTMLRRNREALSPRSRSADRRCSTWPPSRRSRGPVLRCGIPSRPRSTTASPVATRWGR
jgi:hypothetical protein